MKNIMRRLSSIVLISVFFLVVSGMAEIELGCLLGINGNAAYAAKNTNKKVVKKTVNKKKEVTKKRAKTVSDNDYVLPQEWKWFDKPLKLGSVFTDNNNIQEKKSTEKAATFAMALEKMQEIRSKRSEKDAQILAKIKSETKSPSMLKMKAKVMEIKQKADKEPKRNEVVLDAPIVIPSFVAVPSPIKIDSSKNCSPSVDNNQDNNQCEKMEKGNALYSEKTADIAKSNVTPAISQDELNKVITIDDLVAVENEPPAIHKGEIVVEAIDEIPELQNNKRFEEVAKKEEKLYYGVGNKYSDRINKILAERKNKIKVTNDKSEK